MSPNATAEPGNRNRPKPYPAAVARAAVSTAVPTDTMRLLPIARGILPTSEMARKLFVVRSKNVDPSGAAVITALGCRARSSAHVSGTTNTTTDNTAARTYRTSLPRLSERVSAAAPAALRCTGRAVRLRALIVAISAPSRMTGRRGRSVLLTQQPELRRADQSDHDHEHNRQRGRRTHLQLHEGSLVDVHDNR